MYLKLNCPTCDAELPIEDVNLDDGIALCKNCHGVFDFQRELNVSQRQKEIVDMPEGIEVLDLRNELTIELSWKKSKEKSLIFFSLVWNGILLMFFIPMILSGEWGGLFFLSLHGMVGFGLAYYTVATLLNTTYIVANEYGLSVKHRPIKGPFFRDKNIVREDLEQVYCSKYKSGERNGRPYYAFQINALLKNQEVISLMNGLENVKQGRYIEQEVEAFLNIPDVYVDDEF